MKLPAPPRESRIDIDMVPMINFAFLLLIFFMLTGTVASGELLNIKPPLSATQSAAEPGANVLLMSADGQVVLGRNAFKPEELEAQVRQWRAEHIGELLQVKADAELPATQVVKVLETLRAAGIEKVSLLTTRTRRD